MSWPFRPRFLSGIVAKPSKQIVAGLVPVSAPLASTGTFIYVLRSDGNVRGCKVGITSNPTAPLKQPRSTSPCRLGFAFLATVEHSAGAAVELRSPPVVAALIDSPKTLHAKLSLPQCV